MIPFAAVLFAYAGMAAMCIAMAKHQRHTLDQPLTTRDQRRLRIGGGVLLAAAYLCASAGLGWNIGPVAFIGAAIVGGLAVALVLPYRPRWTPRAASGAAALGVITILGGVLFR